MSLCKVLLFVGIHHGICTEIYVYLELHAPGRGDVLAIITLRVVIEIGIKIGFSHLVFVDAQGT